MRPPPKYLGRNSNSLKDDRAGSPLETDPALRPKVYEAWSKVAADFPDFTPGEGNVPGNCHVVPGYDSATAQSVNLRLAKPRKSSPLDLITVVMELSGRPGDAGPKRKRFRTAKF